MNSQDEGKEDAIQTLATFIPSNSSEVNSMCFDHEKNLVFQKSHEILKYSDGKIFTVAGGEEPGNINGAGSEARFNSPSSVCLMPSGEVLIVDSGNNQIRKMSKTLEVTTIAGNWQHQGKADGQGLQAEFDFPWGVCFFNGDYFITDNKYLRKLDSTGYVSTVCEVPNGTCLCSDFYGNLLILTDNDSRAETVHEIRMVSPRNEFEPFVIRVGENPHNGICIDPKGNIYFTEGGRLRKITIGMSRSSFF